MSTDSVAKIIKMKSDGRYEFQEFSQTSDFLSSLCPKDLGDHKVVRLRRLQFEEAGWRTLLLASLNAGEDLHLAIRWAAEVRDMLEELEVSDLYLFLEIPGFPEEDCSRIEASEKFCRRIVIRPNESIEAMLDRTFLSRVDIGLITGENREPLAIALAQLEIKFPWLKEELQRTWRDALLSGTSGGELAELLLKDVPQELDGIV